MAITKSVGKMLGGLAELLMERGGVDVDETEDKVLDVEISSPVTRKAWEANPDLGDEHHLAVVKGQYVFPYRTAEGEISASQVAAITDADLDALPVEIKPRVKSVVARLRKRVEAASGSPVKKAVTLRGKVVKADQMKQVLVVPVLIPEDVDAQEDIYSAEEIEKAAHRFLTEYAKGEAELGLDHASTLDRQKARLVESWLEKADVRYGAELIPQGSWMIAIHIPDVDVWKSALEGERTGASIEGTAMVTPA